MLGLTCMPRARLTGLAHAAALTMAIGMGGPTAAATVTFQGITVPDNAGKVLTVEGLVAPETLGTTLMHEHLYSDLGAPYDGKPLPKSETARALFQQPFSLRNRGAVLWNLFGSNRDVLRLDSYPDAAAEVVDYRNSGGSTLVDVTPIGLGRRPGELAKIARATGVKIVMGAGYYRAAWHPAGMDSRSIDDLTRTIVSDIVVGADGSGVRAGIIGEIPGEDLRRTPRDSNEVRVLRAAARASQLTGAAITLHNNVGHPESWHATLDILQEEGADLNRVVAGHMTVPDVGLIESLIGRGVYVEFDTLGAPFLPQIPALDNRPLMDTIVELIKRGHARQILVSQDVCTKAQLHKFGGYGYDFVLTTLVPYLKSKGVSDNNIYTILQDNPRRVLTFQPPRDVTTQE